MNPHLAIDLNNLDKQDYAPELLAAFVAKHSPADLYAFFKATKNDKFRHKVAKVFRQQALPENFTLDFILELSREGTAEEIAAVLDPVYELNVFSFLQRKQFELFDKAKDSLALCKLVLRLLGEEDGLLLLKLAKMILQDPDNQFFRSEVALQLLKNGLGSTSSCAKLRYLELVVEGAIGNYFACYSDSGLLDQALRLYDTEDVLQKLASVQVLERVGERQAAAEYLRNHPVWECILKDAFCEENPYYVQKNLICLVIKMANKGLVQFNYVLSKKISNFLVSSSEEGGEQLLGLLYITSFLFETAAGIQTFMTEKEVVEKFTAAAHCGTHEEKRMVFSCLGALTTRQEHQKACRLVINVVSVVGHPGIIGGFDMKNNINDYGVAKFVSFLFGHLFHPFEDIELLAVTVLRNLFFTPRLAEEVLREARLVEYLGRQLASNMEIYQLKQEVVGLVAGLPEHRRVSEQIAKAMKERGGEARVGTASE